MIAIVEAVLFVNAPVITTRRHSAPSAFSPRRDSCPPFVGPREPRAIERQAFVDIEMLVPFTEIVAVSVKTSVIPSAPIVSVPAPIECRNPVGIHSASKSSSPCRFY